VETRCRQVPVASGRRRDLRVHAPGGDRPRGRIRARRQDHRRGVQTPLPRAPGRLGAEALRR
jgi:hypothetical protein